MFDKNYSNINIWFYRKSNVDYTQNKKTVNILYIFVTDKSIIIFILLIYFDKEAQTYT